MKVVLINRSDAQGGAAIASHRLLQSLCGCGIEATMLVVDKQSDSDNVNVVGLPVANSCNFLIERLAIFLQNGLNRKTLFKIDTCTHGASLWRHPAVKQADVVVLGWVAQGTISLKGIARIAALGKPVVWIMHDLWNCTGVCHCPLQCTRYRSTCEACPLLGSGGHDLATRTQRRKQSLYDSHPIHFVAVSRWVKDCCVASSLMRQSHVTVIPNTLPVQDFEPSFLPNEDYGLPAHKKIFVMGAARLDDPIKGLDRLIDITRHMAAHKPGLAQQCHLLLYGDMKNPQLLQQLAISHTWIGYTRHINAVYRAAHGIISPSWGESFGYTLLEGIASGCAAVTFDNGGQVDIVEHKKTGYIARENDIADFVQGMEWVVNNPIDRQFLHNAMQEKFNNSIVAEQFIELFKKIV